MSPSNEDFDLYDDPGLHELTHNIMQAKSNCIWKGRSEPLSVLLRAIVIEKLTNKHIVKLSYFTDNIGPFHLFLKDSNVENEHKYKQYRTHPHTMAVMCELVLLAKFGSNAFIQTFLERYPANMTDFTSDQDRIDKWIINFSQVVNENVAPLYEACGLPISEIATQALSKLPKFIID